MSAPLFTFPQIDEIAFSIGPLDIRWYALAYIVGIILGWWLLRRNIKAGLSCLTPQQLDSLLNSCIFGIILGGRLGYVFFYNPAVYLAAPLDILKVWQGGMSFHGGFIGVGLAILWCAYRFHLPKWALADEVAAITPIGLFFGRIANFINGELYGRVSDHPFAIVFPRGGPDPRHPSQLYEAALEGALLFVLLILLQRAKYRLGLKNGVVVSGFLSGYGLARFMVEYVREPDSHLGFITMLGPVSVTMGQILTMPMILAGLIGLYLTCKPRPQGPAS